MIHILTKQRHFKSAHQLLDKIALRNFLSSPTVLNALSTTCNDPRSSPSEQIQVVSLVGLQKSSLHPDDMLLLANFVMSSESFRTSEPFSPICLPRYNPMAFLYAHVHYLDADTYLTLLTTSSQAFFHLKECRIQIEAVLKKSNVLDEVQRSLSEGGMHVENLPLDPSANSGSLRKIATNSQSVGIGGPAGLWHFIYRSNYLDQYVSSEFSSPISTPLQQKRLYKAYQRLWGLVFNKVLL